MAALTTYDSTSNENPLTTLWTTIGALGDCKGVSGTLSPVTAASDSGVVSVTSYTVTDNATTTLALAVKWTLGAMTTGTTIRLIYSYTDANNYYFVKVTKKAVTVTASTTRDSVTLWKVVSGSASQIGASTGLKQYQLEVGDTREEEIGAGTTIRVTHCYNQHVVEINDIQFLHEEDAALTAGGKHGFIFIGATHTNTITKVQAQTMTSYWCATTGSDSNTGARAAPFLSRTKLFTDVNVNKVGFFRTRTFTGSTVITTGSGTSREDGPRTYGYRSETITFQGTAAGHEMIVPSGSTASYRQYGSFTVQGASGGGKFGFNVTGGALHQVIVNLTVRDTQKTAILLVPVGSGTYTGNHVVRDISFVRPGLASLGDHGVYSSARDVDIAYCTSDGQSLSQGYGIHVFSASSDTGCNGTTVRWCFVKNHANVSAAGILLSSGTGIVGRGLVAYDNVGSGIQLWHDADGTILEHSVSAGNGLHGISMGGFDATDCEVAHCTTYGNGSYGVFGETLNVGGLVKNTIAYGNTNGQIGGTNITQTTNLTTNPNFVDASSRNFRLLDTSDAIEAGTDLTADGVTQRDYWMQVIPQNTGITIGAFSETAPPDNPPVITIGTSYAGTVSQSKPITDGLVEDPEGDTLYLDGVFDNVTTTVSATGSGTGALETRS